MSDSTPRSDGVDTQPFGDGTTTRVRFRGWIIDVDAAGELTLPRQGLANIDLDDLRTCMAAAQSLAATKKAAVTQTRRAQAATKSAASTGLATTTPDRRAPITPLVQVLCAARDIAATSWQPRRNDTYTCAKRAWADNNMQIPFAWLTRALRAVLPPDTSLTEFDDTAETIDAVTGLYDRAIEALTVQNHGAHPVAS